MRFMPTASWHLDSFMVEFCHIYFRLANPAPQYNHTTLSISRPPSLVLYQAQHHHAAQGGFQDTTRVRTIVLVRLAYSFVPQCLVAQSPNVCSLLFAWHAKQQCSVDMHNLFCMPLKASISIAVRLLLLVFK